MTPSALDGFDRRLDGPSVRRGGLNGAITAASVAVHLAALLLLCRIAVPVPPAPMTVADFVFAPEAAGLPHAAQVAARTAPAPLPARQIAATSPTLAPVARLAPLPRVVHARHVPMPMVTREAANVPVLKPATPIAGVPVPPPPVSAEVVAGLEARIRHAVQDAAVYPPAARLMRVQGRAQVQFHYRDGSVGAVSLARSSQSAMLDRAALAAVQRALYPRPPPAMADQMLPLIMWVNFGLVSED